MYFMFTANALRHPAGAALAALVFPQGAVAAMGCATLRVDAAHGDIADMPSGEPCDMMGEARVAEDLPIERVESFSAPSMFTGV